MNEIETAIRLISAGEIDYSGIYDGELNEKVSKVILAALREKAERGNGKRLEEHNENKWK